MIDLEDMPDPGDDICGYQVHQSKVRTTPPHIQVQPRQKYDGDHGEGYEEQSQQGVQLAQPGVALGRLQKHLDEIEQVEGEGADAKNEGTIANEGRCMGGLARVGKGLASQPEEEVDEEEAGAKEEKEEQAAHLEISFALKAVKIKWGYQ